MNIASTLNDVVRLLGSGHLSKAEQLCRDVLRVESENVDTLQLLSLIERRTNRIKATFEDLQKADEHSRRAAALAKRSDGSWASNSRSVFWSGASQIVGAIASCLLS